jgi:hypothetical protein
MSIAYNPCRLQMSSDEVEAVKYLNESLRHANLMGFKEGEREATEALRRIQSTANK